MSRRAPVDHTLVLKVIPVSFIHGNEGEATAEGNNAAWPCACGALLVGRCYFQFGDTCSTLCECGRKYKVIGDSRKRAIAVQEAAA
jgi:hypothetical protein